MKTDLCKCPCCGKQQTMEAFELKSNLLTCDAKLTCPICKSVFQLSALLTEPGTAPEGGAEPPEETTPEETPETEEPAQPEAGATETPPEGGTNEEGAGTEGEEGLQIGPKESVDAVIDGLITEGSERGARVLTEALQSKLLQQILPNIKEVPKGIQWDAIKDSDFEQMPETSWHGDFGLCINVVKNDVHIHRELKPPVKFARSVVVDTTVAAGTALRMRVRTIATSLDFWNVVKLPTTKGVIAFSAEDVARGVSTAAYGIPEEKFRQFYTTELTTARRTAKAGASALMKPEEWARANKRRYQQILLDRRVKASARDRFSILIDRAVVVLKQLAAYSGAGNREHRWRVNELTSDVSRGIRDVLDAIARVDTNDMLNWDTMEIDWTIKSPPAKEADAWEQAIAKAEQYIKDNPPSGPGGKSGTAESVDDVIDQLIEDDVPSNLTPNERKILDLLRYKNRPVTTDEILSSYRMVSRQTVSTVMFNLEAQGLVKKSFQVAWKLAKPTGESVLSEMPISQKVLQLADAFDSLVAAATKPEDYEHIASVAENALETITDRNAVKALILIINGANKAAKGNGGDALLNVGRTALRRSAIGTESLVREAQLAETKRQEYIAIRDMVARVASGVANEEDDAQVYRMFGGVSKEYAQGIVRGMNFALSNFKCEESVVNEGEHTKIALAFLDHGLDLNAFAQIQEACSKIGIAMGDAEEEADAGQGSWQALYFATQKPSKMLLRSLLNPEEQDTTESMQITEQDEKTEWSGDFATFNSKLFGLCGQLEIPIAEVEEVIHVLTDGKALELDNDKVTLNLKKATKLIMKFAMALHEKGETPEEEAAEHAAGAETLPPSQPSAPMPPPQEPPVEAPVSGDLGSDITSLGESEEEGEEAEMERRVERAIAKFFESIQAR